MSTIIRLGPEYFPDPTKGKPVSGGSLYIGEPDLDPEVIANQIQVSAIQENGSSVAISQPISTSAGGVPLYNGSPVTLTAEVSYSLKLLDSLGSQVYYVANSSVQDVSELLFLSSYGCDLAAAVADIGSTSTTLIVDCAAIITDGTTVTIPDTLLLDIIKGGSIDGVAGGGTETLVFSGLDPAAGKYQIFGSSLTVTGLKIVYPEWWGVDGTNDGTEINLALAAVASATGVVKLDPAGYNLGTVGIVMAVDSIAMTSDNGLCFLTTASDIDAITISERVRVDNVGVINTGSSTKAGYKFTSGGKNCKINETWAQGFFYNYYLLGTSGTGVGYNEFRHLYSTNPAGADIYMDDSSGWVNENAFFGGNLHTNQDTISIQAAGNNNKFIGMSIENSWADTDAFSVIENGTNVFIGCRFENECNGIYVNNVSANQYTMTRISGNFWDTKRVQVVVNAGRCQSDVYGGNTTFAGYITGSVSSNKVLDGTAASGQAVVDVVTSSGIYPGSAVVLDRGLSNEEWGVVSSITGNALTLARDLINSHDSAETLYTIGRSFGILGRPPGTTYETWIYAYGQPVMKLDGETTDLPIVNLPNGELIAPRGLTTRSVDSDVSNPPTDAQIDSAFGTPATRGDGWIGVIDDAGAGTNVYLILSNGASWYQMLMTKAL